MWALIPDSLPTSWARVGKLLNLSVPEMALSVKERQKWSTHLSITVESQMRRYIQG